jgi:uncharacterized coiled-coil protein SlyX
MENEKFREIEARLSKIEERDARIESKLDQIHTTLFGHEGVGGVHRWVSEINARLNKMETEQAHWRGKILGIAAASSVIMGIIGSKLASLLTGSK